MSEQQQPETFLGTFEQYCRKHFREDFEVLRPRYEAIQLRNQRENDALRHTRLRRLEADKAEAKRDNEIKAQRAELAREAKTKGFLRGRYANMTDAQYDHMWKDIYSQFLMDEANKNYAEMRRDYQF